MRPALAKTEIQCLKQLSKGTKHSYEQITKVLMECNNLFLSGQFVYLRGGKEIDKMIRRKFPRYDETGVMLPVSAIEKADKLLQYTQCEDIARNLKTYLERCQNETN